MRRAHHQAGRRLATGDYGQADDRPPLFLLPGMTFDRTIWRPVVAVVAKAHAFGLPSAAAQASMLVINAAAGILVP